MTYNCQSWGYEKLDILDNLQLQLIRLILKLKQNAPMPMICGETGVYPISGTVGITDENRNHHRILAYMVSLERSR